MGQYFKVINKTKKEFLSCYDVDYGAKFLESISGSYPRLLFFLLRQSDEGGGGDIAANTNMAGHWAGDEISIVGDYDSSGLYDDANEDNGWKRITVQAAKDYNKEILLAGCAAYELHIDPEALDRETNTRGGRNA